MIKKFIAVVTMFAAMLYAVASFAAVDVNKATAAELDAVKGIGPATAAKIVEARKTGNFKDWADFESRVSGIKDKRAADLSGAGLTVNGTAYAGAPAVATKAAVAAKPAAASASAPMTKADAKAKAAADKQAKADAKAKAKADKAAAKADKAASTKPAAAASAAK